MAENGNGEKVLAPEKMRALFALLATGDVAEAAKASGASERTVARWRTEPAFASALKAAQDAALDGTAAQLVSASAAAVKLLKDTVENQAAQLSHRLRAAATLLDATLRWHELRSLSQRVAALEQRGVTDAHGDSAARSGIGTGRVVCLGGGRRDL